MSDMQELIDYDWVIPSGRPSRARLHHITIDDDDGETAWPGPLTAACGRVLTGARIPGIFERMGTPRCVACCRAKGLPTGDGSPKNDDRCRAILGWD